MLGNAADHETSSPDVWPVLSGGELLVFFVGTTPETKPDMSGPVWLDWLDGWIWDWWIRRKKVDHTEGHQKLTKASSTTSFASPNHPCFSRVGQSVGRYAARLESCEDVTMSLIVFNNGAPVAWKVELFCKSAVVQWAAIDPSLPSKLTPSPGLTRTH